MKQLDLFEKEMNWPNDFDGAHQIGGVGFGKSDPLYGAVPPENLKIYESPDKGQTVYERDFGAAPHTRKIIKSSVQQQWNVVFPEEC